MNQPFGRLRASFLAIWAAAAAIAGLSEAELLPTGYLPATPQVQYAVSLACTILTLGGIYIALRLPATAAARKQVADKDEAAALAAYARWNLRQQACIATATLANCLAYYACDYGNAAQFGAVVTLIGSLFCWPSAAAFQSQHNRQP